MPRSTTTISVFLASPSDVQSERNLIGRAVNEWNQIRGREKGVYFDLIRWETGVAAGFGQDGQDVINRAIGDDYDAIIGLFWTRIGTATDRAASGTIEEYERALTRFRETENVEIAFYFKTASVDPSSIDPEQLIGIRDLKTRLERDGGFHKNFADDVTLQFEINLLLDKLARKFSQPPSDLLSSSLAAAGKIAGDPSAAPIGAADGSPTDPGAVSDEGFIDVSENIVNRAEASGQFLNDMSEKLSNLTKNTQNNAEKLNELSSLGPLQIADAKPIIISVASGMDEMSNFLENGASIFSENTLDMAESIITLIDISRDFDTSEDNIRDLNKSLKLMAVSMDEAIEGLNSLMYQTAKLPRMSNIFNKSKKRLVNNLQVIISEIESSRSIIYESLEILKQN